MILNNRMRYVSLRNGCSGKRALRLMYNVDIPSRENSRLRKSLETKVGHKFVFSVVAVLQLKVPHICKYFIPRS